MPTGPRQGLYGARINGLGTRSASPRLPGSALSAERPPDADIIQLEGGGLNETYHLTFANPIIDPIMAILSLGNDAATCTYDFDSPFSILSQVPSTTFAGSSHQSRSLPGNILQGTEVGGTIQFLGYSPPSRGPSRLPEAWHRFTFGIRSAKPSPA